MGGRTAPPTGRGLQQLDGAHLLSTSVLIRGLPGILPPARVLEQLPPTHIDHATSYLKAFDRVQCRGIVIWVQSWNRKL